MDEEEDFVVAAAARGEKLRVESFENALGLSYDEKLRKISTVLHEVALQMEETLKFSPSYLLMEYNRTYREPLEASIRDQDMAAQIELTANIMETLMKDDERIETSLRSGDGDLNGFITAFTEAALLAHVAYGVVEAIALEEDIGDIEAN